jgi:hypothetical protein
MRLICRPARVIWKIPQDRTLHPLRSPVRFNSWAPQGVTRFCRRRRRTCTRYHSAVHVGPFYARNQTTATGRSRAGGLRGRSQLAIPTQPGPTRLGPMPTRALRDGSGPGTIHHHHQMPLTVPPPMTQGPCSRLGYRRRGVRNGIHPSTRIYRYIPPDEGWQLDVGALGEGPTQQGQQGIWTVMTWESGDQASY